VEEGYALCKTQPIDERDQALGRACLVLSGGAGDEAVRGCVRLPK
jgi:hypothetical protein